MKKRSIFLGALVIFYMLIPLAEGDIKESVYLNSHDSQNYSLEFDDGDRLHWSYKTHDDPFEAKVGIGTELVSNGKTSDSGVLVFQRYGAHQYTPVVITNIDHNNSGWIDFEIEVNPLKDIITGYESSILIGIICIISIILCVKFKNLIKK